MGVGLRRLSRRGRMCARSARLPRQRRLHEHARLVRLHLQTRIHRRWQVQELVSPVLVSQMNAFRFLIFFPEIGIVTTRHIPMINIYDIHIGHVFHGLLGNQEKCVENLQGRTRRGLASLYSLGRMLCIVSPSSPPNRASLPSLGRSKAKELAGKDTD